MLSVMGKLIDDFNNLGSIGDFARFIDGGTSPSKKALSAYLLRGHGGTGGAGHTATMMGNDYELVINIDDNEVNYRAEGNANIVLALPKMRKVLRIRKSLIVNSSQTGKCARAISFRVLLLYVFYLYIHV